MSHPCHILVVSGSPRWDEQMATYGTNINSIAFGSASRREVDSHPISPLARPAVSQPATHSLGFLSVADAGASSGETIHVRLSSGRIVMQLASDFLVGGSNPGKVNIAPPPAPPSSDQVSNRRPKILGQLRYHSTGGDATAINFPIAWSLLSENF